MTQDVGSDPTVSSLENSLCLMCGRPVLCGPHMAEADAEGNGDKSISDSVLFLDDLDEPDDWEPDTTDTTEDIEMSGSDTNHATTDQMDAH